MEVGKNNGMKCGGKVGMLIHQSIPGFSFMKQGNYLPMIYYSLKEIFRLLISGYYSKNKQRTY